MWIAHQAIKIQHLCVYNSPDNHPAIKAQICPQQVGDVQGNRAVGTPNQSKTTVLFA